MASKKEQATKILADALGVDASAPPPPPPAPTFPAAPETASEEVEEASEVASGDTAEEAQDGDDGDVDVNELAEMLGISVEDVYGLRVPMADGEKPRRLGDLKDAERRAADLNRKLTALQSEYDTARKALDTAQAQGPAAFQGMPQELDALRLNAARWHEHVYNNPTYWNQIKEDDPAQYAAELVQAQTTAQQAAQQFQMGAMQWQQTQKQQFEELLREKRKALADRDSAWANEDTRRERYNLISKWLRDANAEVPNNLDQILVDPGWTSVLFDAAKTWDNAQKAGDTKAPPRVGTSKLRRSALKTAVASSSKSRISKLVKQAQSGRRADKVAAGEAILTEALTRRTQR